MKEHQLVDIFISSILGFVSFLWLTELDFCTRKIEILFGFRQLKNIDTHSRMNNKT